MSLIPAYNNNSNLGNALEHWVFEKAGEKKSWREDMQRGIYEIADSGGSLKVLGCPRSLQ
jgi:hypothetical protein